MLPEDPLDRLGVHPTSVGGELRVWSGTADAIELVLFDEADPNWITATVPLARNDAGVWSATSSRLVPGRRYGLRVSGPPGLGNTFNPSTILLDPYTRGVARTSPATWQSVVTDGAYDWQGVRKPRIAPEDRVVYEAHVRGMTMLHPGVPAGLRGTYAGLASPAVVDYLVDLGVTTVELLPVHAFASERRLVGQGLTNYWGYNPLAYFAPHPAYATAAAQKAGPSAVLAEFKDMVRTLHAAGIEVFLDVVYNHTAEEEIGGPRFSFRGIDNASYYRQSASGEYVDMTGCGNSLDFSQDAVRRLALDSVRYWAEDVQVDGFRFDLAVTLGRDEMGAFETDHPLLSALRDDPALTGTALVAEPWDIGHDGWQTGKFPSGWQEWNDRFRDSVRSFWLADMPALLRGEHRADATGRLASALAGSADVFARERGPIASVNFVTAHDGFTLADLVSYAEKHNLGNGEQNRDGTDHNLSHNFGSEGETRDPQVLGDRRRAMRNVVGTLLLASGIPMLTAGDEFGRTQRGNNNPYNQDSELTWLSWRHAAWQTELHDVVRRILRLRRENAALRPRLYPAHEDSGSAEHSAAWYASSGEPMTSRDWHDPHARCIQHVSTAGEGEQANAVLLAVSGALDGCTIVLPTRSDADSYELLWTSADDDADGALAAPGSEYRIDGPGLALFRIRSGPAAEDGAAGEA